MTRIFDLLVSLCALVVLSPLFAIVAFLVRVTSRGPVLFRQERVGRGGRTFSILKFRTMRPTEGPAGGQLTIGGDPRITGLGRGLRSSKLDELPQLVNVLRGEMSLVGPRPEVPKYVAEWTEEQQSIILSVRPGITDPASVKFRREEELLAEQPDPETFYKTNILPVKANLYVSYVHTRSFPGDIKILFGTLRSVFSG